MLKQANISKHCDNDNQGAISIRVTNPDFGKRLDLFLAQNLCDANRTRITDAVRQRHILVNGLAKKPSYRVKPDDKIDGFLPPLPQPSFEPENLPLDVLYEDSSILVINKQPGLVVHPAPGNWSGTLVNALLYHYPDIKSSGEELRPGIVHRLDRDTSGVMVVAKKTQVLSQLSEMFSKREVSKQYTALVYGRVKEPSGIIDLPVGRHPVDRKKMSTISPHGKYAETHFTVIRRFEDATLLNCDIKTGRTHQIRVHCLSMNHPLVGDSVYTLRRYTPLKETIPNNISALGDANRQMLHSHRISFVHPVSGQMLTINAPCPDDMKHIIDRLSVCV